MIIRMGLTSESLPECDHAFITVTHQYLNTTNWFLKIMDHLKANLLQWSVCDKVNQKKIARAKETILQDLKSKTDLKLDQVSETSHGGTTTTTTGQQSRRFFQF